MKRTLSDVLYDLNAANGEEEYHEKKLEEAQERIADLEAEANELLRRAGVHEVIHGGKIVSRDGGNRIAWRDRPNLKHSFDIEAPDEPTPAEASLALDSLLMRGGRAEDEEEDADASNDPVRRELAAMDAETAST